MGSVSAVATIATPVDSRAAVTRIPTPTTADAGYVE